MARTRTARRDRPVAVITQGIVLPFPKRTAALYAKKALAALGKAGLGVNIMFIDDAGIRRLNRRFMGRDRATDVLAFDTRDIAISAQTAKMNARRFGSTAADELKLYIIHGILHLCGYDDRTPRARKKMRAMETRLMGKI